MTDTMRAIVLDAPGPPDALTMRDIPIATSATGWVLIEVKARGNPVALCQEKEIPWSPSVTYKSG